MATRALVVGAGISGMATAILLARQGFQVVLAEASSRVGTTLRGFSRQGVFFDSGLHYTGGLHERGPLLHYLRCLGLEDLPLVPFDPQGFDELRFSRSGTRICLPTGYTAMREALCDYFPAERDAVYQYMQDVRSVCEASPFLSPFRDNGGEPLAAMLSPGQLSGQPSGSQEPLARYLAARTQNKELRATLAIHSLLHGVSPEDVTFEQHARIAGSYFDSVHTFAGGGKQLVAALEQRLRELGVSVRCNCAVRNIRLSATGSVAGADLARSGGTADSSEPAETVATDIVVYTAHPSALPDMLPAGTLRPAYSRRLRILEDTPSAYMLFGISKTPLPCLRGRNIFICPGDDLAPAFLPGLPLEQSPIYVAASPQPGGRQATGIVAIATGDFAELAPWHGSVLGARPQAYRDFKSEKLRTLRELLVRACPELADVEFVDGATPLTLRDYLHTPSGSLYGCKHSLHQFNPQPVTRIPGLWMAGQSVVAPGVLGAVVSAFLTCSLLLGHPLHGKEFC